MLLEGHLLAAMASPPPALPVRRLIDDDPIDPGAERRPAAELRKRSKDAKEHFLGEIQCLLRIAEQVQRELVDHPLVVGHQPGARFFVTRGTLLHQRPVGAGCIWPG